MKPFIKILRKESKEAHSKKCDKDGMIYNPPMIHPSYPVVFIDFNECDVTRSDDPFFVNPILNAGIVEKYTNKITEVMSRVEPDATPLARRVVFCLPDQTMIMGVISKKRDGSITCRINPLSMGTYKLCDCCQKPIVTGIGVFPEDET